MSKTRGEQIRARARDRCEYCQIHQVFDVRPFQVDHVRSQKHRGSSGLNNVALACLPCNAFKGPNVAGYDPVLNKLQRLFNPRIDEWNRHFAWDGPILVGQTSIGRTTVEVLRINAPDRVIHRQLLIDSKLFPPRSSRRPRT
jgi:hypothetical protein